MAERKLICAVISRAIEDARINPDIYGENQRDKMIHIRNNARAWLTSKSKRYRGFEWYCGLIDLSPEYIRERLFKEGVLERTP